MRNLLTYLRVSEWYDSKIPMMMSVLLFFYVCDTSVFTYHDFLIRYSCYFIFITMFLAFGYVINDYSDIEVDKRVGKKKLIAQMPTAAVNLSLVSLFILGNLPFLYLSHFTATSVAFVVLTYFLGASYSIKQFRFKEKGIHGLIVCSFAQKSFPLLGILFLIKVNSFQFLCWFLLSFINGLRYILIHQMLDLENDRLSSVHTYVSSGANYVKEGVYLCFVMEIALLGILTVPLFMKHPIIMISLGIAYIIIEWIIITFVNDYMHKPCFFTYDAVPLEDLYNIYIPMVLTVFIAMEYRQAYFLVLLTGIYLFRTFLNKMSMVRVYCKAQLRRSA